MYSREEIKQLFASCTNTVEIFEVAGALKLIMQDEGDDRLLYHVRSLANKYLNLKFYQEGEE